MFDGEDRSAGSALILLRFSAAGRKHRAPSVFSGSCRRPLPYNRILRIIRQGSCRAVCSIFRPFVLISSTKKRSALRMSVKLRFFRKYLYFRPAEIPFLHETQQEQLPHHAPPARGKSSTGYRLQATGGLDGGDCLACAEAPRDHRSYFVKYFTKYLSNFSRTATK